MALESSEPIRTSIEDLIGKKITGTTSASADTETSHAHGLGKVPTRVFIQGVDEAVYLSGDTAAAGFDATNIYVKVASAVVGGVPFTAWVQG